MKTYNLVFDLQQMRPARGLLQIAHGADYHINSRFPEASLLTELTRDLSLYVVTEEELEQLVAMVSARMARH